jgi:hypothetical protein
MGKLDASQAQSQGSKIKKLIMTARLPLKGETGENRWCKAKGSKA